MSSPCKRDICRAAAGSSCDLRFLTFQIGVQHAVLDTAVRRFNKNSSRQDTESLEASPINEDLLVWLALVAFGLLLSLDLPLAAGGVIVFVGCVLAVISPTGATAGVISSIPYVFKTFEFGGSEFSPVELSLFLGGFGVAVRAAWSVLRGEFEVVLDLLRPYSHTARALTLIVLGPLSLTWIADPHHAD